MERLQVGVLGREVLKDAGRRSGRGMWAVTMATILAITLAFGAIPVFAAKAEPPATVPVKRGLLKIVFRLPGVVDASSEVAIQARVAGEVVSLPVKLGQSVKHGQVLLEIDPRLYRRALVRAQADLLEAVAKQRLAEIRLEREQSRYARATKTAAAQSESRNEIEPPPTTYTIELLRQEVALSEAATSRTRIAVEEAKARLADTRLVSPIDGVVTEIHTARGQVVSPADCEQGRTLIKVADLSKIAVNSEIEQGQIRDIQLNLAASVALPAFPDRLFPGRIVSISPKGFSRGGKVLFPIRIALEGEPGDAARPGLSAFCEIVAIEKPNVLLLENRAIRKTGAQATVVVLDQGKPTTKAVKLGRSDGTATEVLGGLREGDKVVLP